MSGTPSQVRFPSFDKRVMFLTDGSSYIRLRSNCSVSSSYIRLRSNCVQIEKTNHRI
jgi:hypothetical protein